MLVDRLECERIGEALREVLAQLRAQCRDKRDGRTFFHRLHQLNQLVTAQQHHR